MQQHLGMAVGQRWCSPHWNSNVRSQAVEPSLEMMALGLESLHFLQLTLNLFQPLLDLFFAAAGNQIIGQWLFWVLCTLDLLLRLLLLATSPLPRLLVVF